METIAWTTLSDAGRHQSAVPSAAGPLAARRRCQRGRPGGRCRVSSSGWRA